MVERVGDQILRTKLEINGPIGAGIVCVELCSKCNIVALTSDGTNQWNYLGVSFLHYENIERFTRIGSVESGGTFVWHNLFDPL